MSDPTEVTVTSPDIWASRPDQLAQLLSACADGRGPSVIPDPSGGPPDPQLLTVIVSPALWAAQPRALGEALALAAGQSGGASTSTRSRTTAGAVAPVQERLVFTVEEAASLLGISRSFAYEAVQRGEIPSMRIGHRILVPKAALERLLSLPNPSAADEAGSNGAAEQAD